jgi:methylated-DNA-[protein]-cysteine S-methyltransferase
MSTSLIIWAESGKWFGAIVSERGIVQLTWSKSREKVQEEFSGYVSYERASSKIVKFQEQLREEIREYFAGRRRKFTVPVAVEGTDFQKSVWTEMAAIPYGKTLSYGELAKRIGKPKACRAVGQAASRNPVGIIIPCHRVLAAGGKIGGFGGPSRALDEKRRLLELEGISWIEN